MDTPCEPELVHVYFKAKNTSRIVLLCLFIAVLLIYYIFLAIYLNSFLINFNMSEQLNELLTRMVSKSENQQAQILHQQNQITSSIQALQQMPGVQRAVEVTVNPAVVAAETIRAEKVQKLALNMRKSNRFKTFKLMVGIDNDLTKEEYIPIFRASLDFSVIERVEQVLKKDAKTWANVSINDLIKLMKDDFGAKHT